MYFYIDESGQTGGNLFDPAQPVFYYGMLSSKFDIDSFAVDRLKRIRNSLKVPRLHAAELGVAKLDAIADDVIDLQRSLCADFDLFYVDKKDLAVICFFDQVFDSGLNESVSWKSYWTIERYVILILVYGLFDNNLMKLAWQARIEANDGESYKLFREVCSSLMDRAKSIDDEYFRRVIISAIEWAVKNYKEILYNAKRKNDQKMLMPNVVCFQFVMIGLARRSKGNHIDQILIDRQAQFNGLQKFLSECYYKNCGEVYRTGDGLPDYDFRGIPKPDKLQIETSNNSCGLELVDIYLWLIIRKIQKNNLTEKLENLLNICAKTGGQQGLSMGSICHYTEQTLSSMTQTFELFKGTCTHV